MLGWSQTLVMAGVLSVGIFSIIAPKPALAADLKPVTLFMEPGIAGDSVWMALAKDLYKAEGLDVQVRLFSSGTTAFQTFKSGIGDIVMSGDLPALQYWQQGNPYRVIAPVERDGAGYAAVATNAIKAPKDLAGKTVSTRVGSTGSYFVASYLKKEGVDDASVKVRNLDPQQMVPALCRGDIDAFFIWQPAPTQAKEVCGDKVHQFTTGDGYMMGYIMLGARPEWLAKPENADIATRFLRATRKGDALAASDEAGDIAYLNQRFGLTAPEIIEERKIMGRVLKMDAAFFGDFCNENAWQERTGMQTGPSDLSNWVWPDGLKAIDPKLVVAAPPPC